MYATIFSPNKKTGYRLILIAFLCLVSTSTLWTQSREESAKNLLTKNVVLKSSTQQEIKMVSRYESGVDAKTPVAVFQSSEKGFVVIIGTDEEHIVAGYSLTGDFNKDQAPDALLTLLSYYEEREEIYSNTQAQLKSSSSFTPISPLLDSKNIALNQFNHTEVGGCYSGCVATAFAQIMAYHQYPERGVGSHCYIHPEFGEICADFEDFYLDWENMTGDDYKLLSYHVGIAMDMGYCNDGDLESAPMTHDYHEALQNHYNYHVYEGYNDTKYLQNELEHNRPVYLGINPYEVYGPGHAVVVDGLDAEGRFHINFGWGGSYNGYFLLNSYTNPIIAGVRKYSSNIARALYISPTRFSLNEQDSLALVAINESFNNSLGWDMTQDFHKLPGVTIMNGRVTELRINKLDYKNEGYFPHAITQLSELRDLNLSAVLHGTIPSSLFQMPNLQELFLEAAYGSTVEKIELPPEIAEMQQLKTLTIKECLQGSIPDEIGALVNIREIELYGNDLTGTIPESISQMHSLENLNLRENKLAGNIPDAIGQMNSLKHLYLDENKISGSIPESIGESESLITISLSNNQISGNLPSSIVNIPNLKDISLVSNQLSGEIPAFIGDLKNLESLGLSLNQLEGEVPSSIGNLTKITFLGLDSNKLTSLPNEIGRLNKIKSLDLSYNQFTTLPDSLVQLNDMRNFYAHNNKIEKLPPNFGAWRKLEKINLSYNQISEFPEELCYLLNLEEVDFSFNKINKLPASFSSFKIPNNINLAENEIEGDVPASLLNVKTNVKIYNNRLLYKNVPKNDIFHSSINKQKPVQLKDAILKVVPNETITIDIRDITNLSHPYNEYYWFKYPESIDVDYKDHLTKANYTISPTLTVSLDENEKEVYYCKIFNDSISKYYFDYDYEPNKKYSMLSILNTEPLTIQAMSEDEQLEAKHPESFIVSSDQINNSTVTDKKIVLTSPFKTRGEIKWQASVDGNKWQDIAPQMDEVELYNNIVSQSAQELILEPTATAFYRCVLTEGSCDPLISEAIKVMPFGQVLFDDIVNTDEEPYTVSVDSIEVTLPKGLHEGNFNLTITKLENPPVAPEGIRMGSVYDVTVSFGSIFDLPIEIKLKNIDASSIDAMDIPNYRAIYFDDKVQEWIPYNEGGVILSEGNIYFRTHHLTKLSWYEINHGWYTHRHENDKVQVIYKYEKNSSEHLSYLAYKRRNINNKPAKPWHTTNIDPDQDGTPYMVQDVAEYMRQIIVAFENVGLTRLIAPPKFTVYVSNTGSGALNKITGSGDAYGYITAGGYSGGYFYLNSEKTFVREEMQRTLAHEYMHYIQQEYFNVVAGNYFFAEAHAPLADRLVWSADELEETEPEINVKKAIEKIKDFNTIYDLLAKPWDSGTSALFSLAEKFTINSADANISSSFLHYMRSYRNGIKLDIVKLLTEHKGWAAGSNWSWRKYIDSRIENQLSSTIGKEYDGFVRYLMTGSNPKFTILNTDGGNPYSPIIKNSGAKNDGTFAQQAVWNFKDGEIESKKEEMQFTVPYLASKIVLLNNQTLKQPIVVTYNRKDEGSEDEKVYYGKYDFAEKKMVFEDISDSTSYSILLDANCEEAGKKYQNRAFLLFVNRRCPSVVNPISDFDADFELIANPIINLNDLIYANVTDKQIHHYDDGNTGAFIISGHNDLGVILSAVPNINWSLLSYDRNKSMVNDSTLAIEVSFTETLTHKNGLHLPASIQKYDKKQTIFYNFYTGRVHIEQLTNTDHIWGAYTDEEKNEHPQHKWKETEDFQILIVKDVLNFEQIKYEGAVRGKAYEYETTGTEHTQYVLEKIAHTEKVTNLDVDGNVTDTSIRNYTHTDFSSENVKIVLQFNYE